jgi:SAM-dependent methyltransferase
MNARTQSSAPVKEDNCCAPSCCTPDSVAEVIAADRLNPSAMSADELRNTVRDKYGAIAQATTVGGCGCGTTDLESLGYSRDQVGVVPEGADLGLGCGNPLQHAAVQPGETVLDLGSGAGVDAFLAAREVGPTGRVIGVDMTPAMLDRARANARKIEAHNVEFRLGEIEQLPVADNSVDVIISNCVINLSPDKPAVFAEAMRVLRPGGRVVVSDLVLLENLPKDIESSVTAYVGCVAGASHRDAYLRLLRDAKFENVEVVEEKRYAGVDADTQGDAQLARTLAWSAKNVVSVKVRAYKPQ